MISFTYSHFNEKENLENFRKTIRGLSKELFDQSKMLKKFEKSPRLEGFEFRVHQWSKEVEHISKVIGIYNEALEEFIDIVETRMEDEPELDNNEYDEPFWATEFLTKKQLGLG